MNEAAVRETVVIGLGNPLMGDDGLGILVLERLRDGWAFRPPLELLDGGTWGLNLLPHIERSSRLLILDAIDAGAEPGSLVQLEKNDIPRFLAGKLSPHQIDLKEVLAIAELRDTLPEEIVAVGLQPFSIEMREGLSAPVAAGVPRLIERVLERLRDWGYAGSEAGGPRSA